jgi:hypothetical protein
MFKINSDIRADVADQLAKFTRVNYLKSTELLAKTEEAKNFIEEARACAKQFFCAFSMSKVYQTILYFSKQP